MPTSDLHSVYKRLLTKKQAIQEAPQPNNVQQLQTFLRRVNYYYRFLSNLAPELHPLHQLLQKDNKGDWSSQYEKTFLCAKELIKQDTNTCWKTNLGTK